MGMVKGVALACDNRMRMRGMLLIFFALPLYAVEPELVSVDAHRPALNRDGQIIAFESKSNIYVLDRSTKKLERIVLKEPNRALGGPDISDKGNLVTFHAYLPGKNSESSPRVSDIYVYNRQRNIQERVTFPYGDLEQNGEALYPQFSANGRFVLFTSNASNLPPPLKEQARSLYFSDRYNNKLEMVSRNANGHPADRSVGDPRASQNGRYVFFKSAATNLIGKLPETHLSSRLYRVDRWEGRVVRIDDEERGFDQARWAIGSYTVDDEGDFVVFEGRDRNAPDPDKQLETTTLFLFDAPTTVISELLPAEYTGKAHLPAVSANGRYVAFSVRPTGLAVFDRETREVRMALETEARHAVFSADGRVIAFETPVPKVNVYVIQNPFLPL